MNNRDLELSLGFTLAEVIVSLLVLSIVAVGAFQTFHKIQSSSKSSLNEFQKIQLEKQLFSLSRLKLTYPNISASDEFQSLICLIETEVECQ